MIFCHRFFLVLFSFPFLLTKLLLLLSPVASLPLQYIPGFCLFPSSIIFCVSFCHVSDLFDLSLVYTTRRTTNSERLYIYLTNECTLHVDDMGNVSDLSWHSLCYGGGSTMGWVVTI